MNRGQYKAMIRSLVGVPQRGLQLEDVELDLLVDLQRIWTVRNGWGFNKDRFKTTNSYAYGGVADPEYKDLPDDFIIELFFTLDGYRCFKIDFEDYIVVSDNYFYTPSTKSPVWFKRDNRIGVTPSSIGQTGILYYIAKPTLFSSLSSAYDTTDEKDLNANPEIFIPEELQMITVLRCCEILAARKDIEYNPTVTSQGELDKLLGVPIQKAEKVEVK